MKIEQIRDIERRLGEPDRFPWDAELEREDVVALLGEVRRLRQGLWDCVGISGADTDGQTSPDALTYPDIVEYAKREVGELRDDYDASLAECQVH